MHYITSLTQIPITQSGLLTINSTGDMFRAALVKKDSDDWQIQQALSAIEDSSMFQLNPAWDEILVVEPSNNSANIMLKFIMAPPQSNSYSPAPSTQLSLSPSTTNSLTEWWNKQTAMYKWIFGIAIAILVILIILMIVWLVKKNGKPKMSSQSIRSTPASLSYF